MPPRLSSLATRPTNLNAKTYLLIDILIPIDLYLLANRRWIMKMTRIASATNPETAGTTTVNLMPTVLTYLLIDLSYCLRDRFITARLLLSRSILSRPPRPWHLTKQTTHFPHRARHEMGFL